jgi:hypothetical protein
MAALTEAEQASILYHTQYVNWSSVASSYQLGFPAPSQPEYLVRDAFGRITDDGLELVRRDLFRCECTEEQLFDAQRRLKASKVGDITLNAEEIPKLERALKRWQNKLARDLGAYINPWADINAPSSGINARVVNG